MGKQEAILFVDKMLITCPCGNVSQIKMIELTRKIYMSLLDNIKMFSATSLFTISSGSQIMFISC